MDINEVKAAGSSQILSEKTSSTETSASGRTPAKTEASSTDSPSVTVDVCAGKHDASALVSNLNDLISTANVAGKAVEEIERYVQGISGIVEQALQADVPESRLNILETEANQLVEAIKKTTQVQAPNGVHPLQGESFKAELEETLGKTLEIMLPDVSTDALGLGQMKLSTKDFIVNTRALVLRSQERLQELRNSLEEASKQIRDAAAQVSIATQNTEASQNTLRDVEAALSFAGETGSHISDNPQEALGSVTRLNPYALGLLRQES